MALHLAFEKSTESALKVLIKWLTGPYVHVDMLITQVAYNHAAGGSPTLTHTAYSAFMYETFSRTEQQDFMYGDDTHDFLSLSVTPEELYNIRSACEACVKSRIPYNTFDMALSQLPLRNPAEGDVYHTSALFCSQAMVLMLRSGLDPDHELQGPLATVNSRTISPSGLYSLLKPYSMSRTKAQTIHAVYNPDVHF
jgi:hypothetical protein